ncbi:MAG TPA: AbrB/MazE/SpoVT family DNA-binding domain-containing protein [Chloroflexota bacterium]|nr:AbrB/MazE/SpoVT family DNA-binding domain-containing protein [Chloroflexota bacterium]
MWVVELVEYRSQERSGPSVMTAEYYVEQGKEPMSVRPEKHEQANGWPVHTVTRIVGETTITGKNQISLPAAGLRAVGWARGDHLLVEVVHDDMLVLIRRPARWADAFAGKLGHVFGSHDEAMAFLEEEQGSWDEDPDNVRD